MTSRRCIPTRQHGQRWNRETPQPELSRLVASDGLQPFYFCRTDFIRRPDGRDIRRVSFLEGGANSLILQGFFWERCVYRVGWSGAVGGLAAWVISLGGWRSEVGRLRGGAWRRAATGKRWRNHRSPRACGACMAGGSCFPRLIAAFGSPAIRREPESVRKPEVATASLARLSGCESKPPRHPGVAAGMALRPWDTGCHPFRVRIPGVSSRRSPEESALRRRGRVGRAD